jgi:hypothetical protein
MGNADADDELSDPTEHDNGIYEDEGSSDEDAELTQDSKDVLMDRINDLLHRLAIGGSLKGENISSLHAKVDEMEKVLASDHSKPARPRGIRQTPSLMQLASPLPVMRRDSITDGADERDQGSYWGLPATPNKPLAHRFSELSGPTTAIKDPFIEQQHVNGYPLGKGLQQNDEPQQDGEPQLEDEFHQDSEHLDEQQVDATDHQEVQIPSTVAEQVVHEAEKICAELNRVLRNLQDRREESDARPLSIPPSIPPYRPLTYLQHLHAMLIDRAENAARRILELEELVTALEDELDTNRSDLDHLRLQLRAVEVLCYEYVPPDADRDLLQSIENWKMDYSRIKREMATRRRERIPGESVVSPSVLSPSTTLLIERAELYN